MNFTAHNAKWLSPDGWNAGALSVVDGLLTCDVGQRVVDLKGFELRPGIVDMHGDGFERHLAPRRGAVKDLGAGLEALDAELSANGITTAWLAQFWSWEGGMRAPDFARALAMALQDTKPRLHVDMRIQLRVETTMVDRFDEIADFVERARIGYVVFNDHVPHAALAAGKTPPRLIGQALKGGRSPEAHLSLLQALHARRNDVLPALGRLAARLRATGVRLGSHDDADGETRIAYRRVGADVAEFPKSAAAARAAKENGDRIVLGAPNVVRGGSHAGNTNAKTLVDAGLCDVLASDYHYPSLRQAAARLGAGDWELISAGPARTMRLRDRGVLAPGKRADFVVTEPNAGRVVATFVAGRCAFMTASVVERFMTDPG